MSVIANCNWCGKFTKKHVPDYTICRKYYGKAWAEAKPAKKTEWLAVMRWHDIAKYTEEAIYSVTS